MIKRILSIATIFILLSFTSNNNEKEFVVKAQLAQWETILRVIDLSKADPELRVAAREHILRQLNDTTINKR